jgi:hypothetical protein
MATEQFFEEIKINDDVSEYSPFQIETIPYNSKVYFFLFGLCEARLIHDAIRERAIKFNGRCWVITTEKFLDYSIFKSGASRLRISEEYRNFVNNNVLKNDK